MSKTVSKLGTVRVTFTWSRESSRNVQLTLVHQDEGLNAFFPRPGRRGRCTLLSLITTPDREFPERERKAAQTGKTEKKSAGQCPVIEGLISPGNRRKV